MEKKSKIFIAGHLGMVGSAIKRKLELEGYTNLIFKTRQELDLLDQKAVSDFFVKERPEFVFCAAARVGGILANDTYSADFIYENITVQSNIINSSYRNNVKKLLFLGSSCIYPKECPQPIKEEYLLNGLLEKTNEGYAVAKIAGIKMCELYRKQYGCDFISLIPTNLFGMNDNYDLQNCHVLPALIARCYHAKISNAKEICCWGTGSPLREFLYVDDLADACLFLMLNYSGLGPVNVGTGSDITISDLANIIAKVVGFSGVFKWNTLFPDGTKRKCLDISKIQKLGWNPKTALVDGIKRTFIDFLEIRK
jgi:GDP-L-fucose synthase